MRIAINGNKHQEGHLEEIDRLVSHIIREGHDVVMAEPFLNYLDNNLGGHFAAGIDYIPLTRRPQADMAISIGGDGAFLKTARWVGNSEIPVAGINTGHLGYLSAFTFENAEESTAIFWLGISGSKTGRCSRPTSSKRLKKKLIGL